MARFSVRITGPLPPDGRGDKRHMSGMEFQTKEQAVKMVDHLATSLAKALGGTAWYDPEIESPTLAYVLILAPGVTAEVNRKWPPGQPRTGLLASIYADRGPLPEYLRHDQCPNCIAV